MVLIACTFTGSAVTAIQKEKQCILNMEFFHTISESYHQSCLIFHERKIKEMFEQMVKP